MLQSTAWHAKKEAEAQAWLRVQAEHNLQALRAGLQGMLQASTGTRDGDEKKAVKGGADEVSRVRSPARPWSTPSSPRGDTDSYSWKVLIAAAGTPTVSGTSRRSVEGSSECGLGFSDRCTDEWFPGTPREAMIASSSEDTRECSRTDSSSSSESQACSRAGRFRPRGAGAEYRCSSGERHQVHTLREAGGVSSRSYANRGRSSSWGDGMRQVTGIECDRNFEWELPEGWSLGRKEAEKGRSENILKGGGGRNGSVDGVWSVCSPRSVGEGSEGAAATRYIDEAGVQAECESETGDWHWQDAPADWDEDSLQAHGCMVITSSTSFTE